MFLIEKDETLSLNKITEIIQKFCTGERTKLTQYYNYYKGKQAIMSKAVTDTSKPCNRIVANYCFNIVNNYLGYLTGVDITYVSQYDISEIQEVLNYNDVRTADTELLRNALIYGKSFEVAYIDEDNKQRFKVLDSKECIPVYDNTLNQNLVYVIRFYPVDTLDILKGYMVEVYDSECVRIYRSNETYASLSLVEEKPHFYKQVPITVFSLNVEEESIFDKVMSLQDAYNNLLSSEVDDFQAFCDAYLILKGCTAQPEDIQSMKENRVLILDAEADATYLSKSISDTQIENMLTNIDAQIHKIANSPNFSDASFGTSSGIALRYRLIGFENTSSAIVANMTKALQKRIELICEILSLTEGTKEATWRDISITFTRNLPADLLDIAQTINQLRGVVSDKTLISLLPFVKDADKEAELLKEDAPLYSFGDSNE